MTTVVAGVAGLGLLARYGNAESGEVDVKGVDLFDAQVAEQERETFPCNTSPTVPISCRPLRHLDSCLSLGFLVGDTDAVKVYPTQR